MPEQWPVRIFDEQDPRSGASGFLIDSQRVLTCAHVVDKMVRPIVRFAMCDALGDLPATVDIRPDWKAATDGMGDVAVLTLPDAVPIEPVRLAPRSTHYAQRSLRAIGFPLVADDIGKIATAVAPRPGMLHRGEWVQLDSADGFGPAVAGGYSGAAVMLAETSEVVGLVVQADRHDRTGLMLPVHRILEYRPELLDLVPLGPLDPAAHGELRRLLGDVELVDAERVFRLAIGDDLRSYRPEADASVKPETAYAVARHLAEGHFGAVSAHVVMAGLARLCGLVADQADHPDRSAALRAWQAEHAPAPAPRPSPPAPAPPVPYRLSVRVARSGAGSRLVLLEIAVDRPDGRSETVLSERVTVARLQGVVEESLPMFIDRHIPSEAELLIEFVLPRSWLAKNVDEWRLGRKSTMRVGWLHPVVVRDRARFDRNIDDRQRRRRWAELADAPDGSRVVNWVGCRATVTAGQLTADFARNPTWAILALSYRPHPIDGHPAVRAGFDSGVPVMLWRRAVCECPHAGPCAGDVFRSGVGRRLVEHFATGSIHELPELVRQLRLDAGTAMAPAGITLLWDAPPDRNPSRKLAMAGNET